MRGRLAGVRWPGAQPTARGEIRLCRTRAARRLCRALAYRPRRVRRSSQSSVSWLARALRSSSVCPKPPSPVDSSKGVPDPTLPWSNVCANLLYIVIYVYWHRITPDDGLHCQVHCALPSRCASSGAWSGGRSGVTPSRSARTQARVRAEVAAEPWSRRGVGGGVIVE